MPLALLVAATLTGLICALVWLSLGGAIWSTVIVYVLSGNLTVAAMLSRYIWRGDS